jgi:hypothetical protein
VASASSCVGPGVYSSAVSGRSSVPQNCCCCHWSSLVTMQLSNALPQQRAVLYSRSGGQQAFRQWIKPRFYASPPYHKGTNTYPVSGPRAVERKGRYNCSRKRTVAVRSEFLKQILQAGVVSAAAGKVPALGPTNVSASG